MTNKDMPDNLLIERLNKEPALRSRIVDLLELVSNSSGDFDTANSAEVQVIENLQQFGGELLTAWANEAERTCQRRSKSCDDKGTKHGKKKSAGIQSMGKSN